MRGVHMDENKRAMAEKGIVHRELKESKDKIK